MMIHSILASASPSLPDPFITAAVVAVLVRSNVLPFSGRIMDSFHRAKDRLEHQFHKPNHRDSGQRTQGNLTFYLLVFAASIAILAFTVIPHLNH
jgi:hypothetical protein